MRIWPPFKKEKVIIPPKPRFCEKGHDLTYARMLYFHVEDTVGKDYFTKWLCPYCLIDFINENISGKRE